MYYYLNVDTLKSGHPVQMLWLAEVEIHVFFFIPLKLSFYQDTSKCLGFRGPTVAKLALENLFKVSHFLSPCVDSVFLSMVER